MAFINDILIATNGSLENHHYQVSKVLQLLMDNHMYAEINRCIIDAKGVPLFGFHVIGFGLRMDPDKAAAIVHWPQPNNKKEVQQLLELWNVYGRFVPRYAAIVSPITDLLKEKDQNIIWQDSQEAAFLKITILFTSPKTLILRQYNSNRPDLVKTDVSDFAIAGILSQTFEHGKSHTVNFISRRLTPVELHYDVCGKEMLAIVFSSPNGRHVLQSAAPKTILRSNHQHLTYFKTAISSN
jgi:hypothetical protein